MPKRNTIISGGQRYLVVPYDGFAVLGMRTDPAKPLLAVPLFDRIEACIEEPLALAHDLSGTQVVSPLSLLGAGLRAALDRGAVGPLRAAHGADLEPSAVLPEIIFRGESREERGMVSSLFRQVSAWTSRGRDRIVQKRLQAELAMAERVRRAFIASGRPEMTMIEARAAARHYGATSTLLDFSFEPRIAAFFGHPPYADFERAQKGATPIGVIYGLAMASIEQCFGILGWKPEGDRAATIRIYGASGATVPYLAADMQSGEVRPAEMKVELPKLAAGGITIRMTRVPSVARINAQKGLFIEIGRDDGADWQQAAQLWYLLDFVCHKWCYIRQDRQFEDAQGGITAAKLFPPEELSREVQSQLVGRP